MRTRLTAAIALAFALACTAAGLATAAWAPTNANHFDGRSPDTKDAAIVMHHGSRVLLTATAQANWPPVNGIGYDGRSPDTKDAAAVHASQSRTTAAALTAKVDGRSPDTKDAAAAAHTTPSPVVIVAASGFNWTDAGIGAATGLGLAVVLGAGLALARSRRALTTT
jgi:hypothetical protein